MKRAHSTAESNHLSNVAELPCALCAESPCEVHHIREGQGMSQRASHYLTVPLCPGCHRGPQGVHGDKTMLRIHKTSEIQLLADTIEKLVSNDKD